MGLDSTKLLTTSESVSERYASRGLTNVDWSVQPAQYRHLSVKEISQLTGICRSTTGKRLRRGIPVDQPLAKDLELPKPEGMSHLTWQQIGDLYGLGAETVRHRTKEGIPLDLSKEEATKLAVAKKRKPKRRVFNEDRPELTDENIENAVTLNRWMRSLAQIRPQS